MSLLEIDRLRVTYGGTVLALEQASLTVPEGGAVALLGANGAGKTTLLRAVGGLLRYHHGEIRGGEIRFRGESIGRADAARLVASGIAQSLEGRRVFAELTVEENLRCGAFVPRARAGAMARQAELLELFPRLAERLDNPAGLLSGGEQQMLAIARALMASVSLLLLDEPSLGLAPLVAAEIGRTLRQINASGTAVLLVDQSTTLALHATDHAYLMVNGRTVADGPTPTLLSDDRVRESYLGTAAGADRVLAEVQEQ
jgi:ABC-type branched-subunit amino acid transport system ATPase component